MYIISFVSYLIETGNGIFKLIVQSFKYKYNIKLFIENVLFFPRSWCFDQYTNLTSNMLCFYLIYIHNG